MKKLRSTHLTNSLLTFTRRLPLMAAFLVFFSLKGLAYQPITITGKVSSEAGEPLSGVSVTVKGASGGTATDAQGNYSINVPSRNSTLVFSYVGYTAQELSVGAGNTLDVTLNPSAATRSLSEVVVIGYGTASKRDLTGSISKIAGKEVAERPNTNPISSLQNKVAGLSVVNSATPGTEPDVRIRGTISIGSVKPLYVVDGIFNDNINFLNPNDIESIEILKDPSSLAIFGVRGAGGVIAITTKKAKAGQLVVNLNSSYGAKKLVDKIEFANADEFKTLLAEESENRLHTDPNATAIRDFINTQLNNWTGNTNWIDVLTRTAHFNNNNISVSSSTEKNRTYFSVGYNTDQGLVRHTEYKRFNVNINDELRLNKALKLGFGVIGSREDLPYGDAPGLLAEAKRLAPIVSSAPQQFRTRLYGTDTALMDLYSAVPVIQNTLANPLLVLENNWNKFRDRQDRLVGNVFGELTFLKNLNLRVAYYGDLGFRDQVIYTPLYNAFSPALPADSQVVQISTLTGVNQRNYEYRKYQQDYILTYKKNFGAHGLTGTAGWTTYYFGQFENGGVGRQSASADPIPNNKRFWYISNGFIDPSQTVSSSYQKEAATTSALFRILYNYNNKYYLNGSFRRDGSSLIYNPDTRNQNFWAVGAAWELTKEDFMNNIKFLNFLKLKGSIGVLGNQNTYNTDYPYFPTISAGASAVFGNTVYPAYANNYLVDPNLKWETVHGKEVGFELGALQNRLSAELDYYYKETKDMLAYLRPLGVLPTLSNLGGLVNKGFEFSAGWSQSLKNDLSFNINANLTTYNNKVTRLDYPLPADEQFPNQTEVGYPIGHFYGYVVEGIYQNDADTANSPKVRVGAEYGPGDFKYKDISGPNGKPDGIINELDKTDIGNPTPDFTYGASLGLNYRNFDFGIDLTGVSGNEIYRYWNTSENVFSVYNYPKYMLNRWHGEGTSNTIPKVDQTRKINRLPSTYGIENGSYVRLRNVQIGYNFKQAFMSRAHIKNLRLYFNVQNLKTWKHNMGYSPEFAGTNINGQTATSFGIDIGDANSAIPRIFTGGINVTF